MNKLYTAVKITIAGALMYALSGCGNEYRNPAPWNNLLLTPPAKTSIETPAPTITAPQSKPTGEPEIAIEYKLANKKAFENLVKARKDKMDDLEQVILAKEIDTSNDMTVSVEETISAYEKKSEQISHSETIYAKSGQEKEIARIAEEEFNSKNQYERIEFIRNVHKKAEGSYVPAAQLKAEYTIESIKAFNDLVAALESKDKKYDSFERISLAAEIDKDKDGIVTLQDIADAYSQKVTGQAQTLTFRKAIPAPQKAIRDAILQRLGALTLDEKIAMGQRLLMEEKEKAEQAKKAEEARKAEEAKKAEQAKKAEEARKAEQAKKAGTAPQK